VEVGDGGEGEAEEEVVGGLAGELAGVEGGHAVEVGAVEEVGVEPVDAAFMAAEGSVMVAQDTMGGIAHARRK
jgi:hypothetical protein